MLIEEIAIFIDPKKHPKVRVTIDWANFKDPSFEAEGSTVREALRALIDKFEKYKSIDPNQMTFPNV